MVVLTTHSVNPPGEFFIAVRLVDGQLVDHDGQCNGTPGCYRFGPMPEIKITAQELVAFCKANKIPMTFAEAVERIDKYTCQRLGNGNRWCRDTEAPTYTAAVIPKAGCGGCGIRL